MDHSDENQPSIHGDNNVPSRISFCHIVPKNLSSEGESEPQLEHQTHRSAWDNFFFAIVEPPLATRTDEHNDASAPKQSDDNIKFTSQSKSNPSSPSSPNPGIAHRDAHVRTEEDDDHEGEPPEEEDDDDDEGALPDNEGWHAFPILPKSKKAVVYIAHNGDFQFLQGLDGKFPWGIRTPEGYMWGRSPDEFLWIESAPNFVSRCTVSQIRLMDPMLTFELFTEDGKLLHTEEQLANEETIELMLGKPTIVESRGYSPANHRLATFLGIGPERLDVHIPYANLPRVLDVYDEDDVTNPLSEKMKIDSDDMNVTFDRLDQRKCPRLSKSPAIKPHRYRLVDPKHNGIPLLHPDNGSHGTLIISKSRCFGSGTTGHVYEAQIELEIKDEEDAPTFPPVLTVIVKVSSGESGTLFLKHEAKTYHSFPEHFKHEYTGYQLVKPWHIPQKLHQIVPHFYGYYEPEDYEPRDKRRTPLLMMEDCGSPIDSRSLTQYQKAEIMTMFQRFHDANFLHGSIASRNILAQPGPPTKDMTLNRCPRWARSVKKPSFRIVDFGRTINLNEAAAEKHMRERKALSEVLRMRLPI